jgi:hypothetical protein
VECTGAVLLCGAGGTVAVQAAVVQTRNEVRACGWRKSSLSGGVGAGLLRGAAGCWVLLLGAAGPETSQRCRMKRKSRKKSHKKRGGAYGCGCGLGACFSL